MFIKKLRWLQTQSLITFQGRVIDDLKDQNAELVTMVRDLEAAFTGLYNETRGKGKCSNERVQDAGTPQDGGA